MKTIISAAASAITALVKRFSDWLCDTDPAKTQVLARTLGTLVIMFGILLIAWAMTLSAVILAISQAVFTILATSLIIFGGMLWLPFMSKGGVK